jgi:hypothetical protein
MGRTVEELEELLKWHQAESRMLKGNWNLLAGHLEPELSDEERNAKTKRLVNVFYDKNPHPSLRN